MANYNKVILMGNLTRAPQLSFLPSQTPVVDFGMATNRKWKDKDGKQQEEICFVDCVAFGRQAETINQYMSKGSPIHVDGRLKFESWEKDGKKRNKLKVLVESAQFLGKPGDSAAPQERQAPQAQTQQPETNTDFPQDSIPF